MRDLTMFVFVIVAAVAILLQMGILYFLYRALRESTSRVEAAVVRMEQQATPVLASTRAILEDAEPKLAEITSNLAETTATVRANVAQMAETTGEIMDRARIQAARLDELVSTTVDKIELTTDFMQHSVIRPVRRIQAIMSAVSAGLSVLRAGRARKKSAENNGGPDEEMFI